MTQPHRYTSGHASLDQLTPRLEEFDQIAASLFSGHDSMRDTPWVEPSQPSGNRVRPGWKDWCAAYWPDVRASAAKHLSEAKRRMLS